MMRILRASKEFVWDFTGSSYGSITSRGMKNCDSSIEEPELERERDEKDVEESVALFSKEI